MEILREAITQILSFKSYVMLPILMLILSIVVRLKLKNAFRACITLGIGFIGIFIVFDHFVSKIGPVLKLVIKETGINLNVLDVGWPPLAGIAWTFKYTAILILITILINIIMLILKLTQIVNIDIWNYWHFIFTAQLTYELSGNIVLSIGSAIFITILCIKIADWSIKDLEYISDMRGIAITTLSAIIYYPFSVFMNRIYDSIPGLCKVKANPEHIKEKLDFFGEPMFLGIIMGLLLGIFAKYNIKDILDLSFNIAAVVYILPKMAGILGEGLMPISEATKAYMINKFPSIKNSYIGLDVAVLVGNPAIIVTGILLMPVALVLAFILPGIKFIPLGDLPNMIGAMAMVVVAARGNVVRSVITGIPIIIGKLYVASAMASTYTMLSRKNELSINGYDGTITSFLDGGNIIRYWVVQLFSDKGWAITGIPVIFMLLYITRRFSRTRVG